MSQRKPDSGVSNTPRRQPVDITRLRRDVEPQVPSVRAGIYGRFHNGASLKSLADAYGCVQAFIVAVIRFEARAEREKARVEREALRAEIARLRMELQQMRRVA